MVFVVAHSWGTHTPNVAIDAIFSPARLIGLDRGTGADLCLEIIKHGLSMMPDPVEPFHDLACAHKKPMQISHALSQLLNGQAHQSAQVGDHTGKSHSDAPLPKYLLMQVHWRFMRHDPSEATRQPARESRRYGPGPMAT